MPGRHRHRVRELATVRAVAETGVDYVSVGALTHAATSLDVALDWLTG